MCLYPLTQYYGPLFLNSIVPKNIWIWLGFLVLVWFGLVWLFKQIEFTLLCSTGTSSSSITHSVYTKCIISLSLFYAWVQTMVICSRPCLDVTITLMAKLSASSLCLKQRTGTPYDETGGLWLFLLPRRPSMVG